MNWLVFSILAYLFTALQLGLSPTLAIHSRFGPITPHFELALLVLPGLFAPSRQTVLSWAVMGLILDLAIQPYVGDATIIGPHALGYAAGGYVVLQLRTMVVRTHPLSWCFAAVAGGIAAMLVVTGILTFRGWYDPAMHIRPAAELAARMLDVLYSAPFALLFAWPLMKLSPALGLQLSKNATRRGM
ncbi:MAG: hypothetical protein WC058_05615 [Phycisphaeraceae bacterium]